MQHFVIMNIGCDECGDPSEIVGMFDSKKNADYFTKKLQKKAGWRRRGPNKFMVFPLPQINRFTEEYEKYIYEDDDSFG